MQFTMATHLPKSKRDINKKSRNGISIQSIVSHLLVGICGIYIGISFGTFSCTTPEIDTAKEPDLLMSRKAAEKIAEKVTEKVTEEVTEEVAEEVTGEVTEGAT